MELYCREVNDSLVNIIESVKRENSGKNLSDVNSLLVEHWNPKILNGYKYAYDLLKYVPIRSRRDEEEPKFESETSVLEAVETELATPIVGTGTAVEPIASFCSENENDGSESPSDESTCTVLSQQPQNSSTSKPKSPPPKSPPPKSPPPKSPPPKSQPATSTPAKSPPFKSPTTAQKKSIWRKGKHVYAFTSSIIPYVFNLAEDAAEGEESEEMAFSLDDSETDQSLRQEKGHSQFKLKKILKKRHESKKDVDSDDEDIPSEQGDSDSEEADLSSDSRPPPKKKVQMIMNIYNLFLHFFFSFPGYAEGGASQYPRFQPPPQQLCGCRASKK